MEFVVNSNTVISCAQLIASIGAIIGIIRWGVKYVDHDKKLDERMDSLQETQTVILYGVSACLKGMKEQGCDGPVEEALKRLESHLIETANDSRKKVAP